MFFFFSNNRRGNDLKRYDGQIKPCVHVIVILTRMSRSIRSTDGRRVRSRTEKRRRRTGKCGIRRFSFPFFSFYSMSYIGFLFSVPLFYNTRNRETVRDRTIICGRGGAWRTGSQPRPVRTNEWWWRWRRTSGEPFRRRCPTAAAAAACAARRFFLQRTNSVKYRGRQLTSMTPSTHRVIFS